MQWQRAVLRDAAYCQTVKRLCLHAAVSMSCLFDSQQFHGGFAGYSLPHWCLRQVQLAVCLGEYMLVGLSSGQPCISYWAYSAKAYSAKGLLNRLHQNVLHLSRGSTQQQLVIVEQ